MHLYVYSMTNKIFEVVLLKHETLWIFLSEHVNNTVRVWFETIINRYPHTFQWRQNSTCFIISSLECWVFHSPVFFESMMLRRYQWLYQRQVVRWVHLWGCGQTHEGCPPHTNCCGQDLSCDFCLNHQRIWEMIWIWSQTVEFQDVLFRKLHDSSTSTVSMYILLCSRIYKYRNMQILFLMVKPPVKCSQFLFFGYFQVTCVFVFRNRVFVWAV